MKKYNDYQISLVTDVNKWDALLDQFSDANIYQTWNYAKILQDEKYIEHIAIYKNEEAIALAQVRIKLVPVLKRGVAYIFSGPVWRKMQSGNNSEHFTSIVEFLKIKYASERKLVLRIRPFIFSDEISALNIDQEFFTDINFEKLEKSYNSILLNLDEELEVINKNLKPRWRNYLNQSVKNDLKVVAGFESKLFEAFIGAYEQMMERKNFREYVSPEKMMKLNETLNDRFKCKIFIAYKDDQPVAGLVGTAIASTGIYLVGATNDLGLELRASYLLHWEMIKWVKSMGCLRYDLGGINKERNPGGYKFKSGISKQEIADLGMYQICENSLSKFFLTIGERFRQK